MSDYNKGYRDGFKDGWDKAREAPKPYTPPWSQPDIGRMPVGPGLVSAKCPKCFIDFTGAMGFVCSSNDCPIQPKIIACSNNEKL